jgi:putative ABC transport system substrate-binding protein
VLGRVLAALAFPLALLPGPAMAGDIAVLLTADVPQYRDAIKGFRSALKGHRVTAEYDMRGDPALGARMVDEIKTKDRPDMVFAVGIYALQVAAANAGSLPVVYAMVLNPPSLLPAAAKNVTGASMNVPVDQTFQVLKQLGPGIRKVGVLYHPDKTGYLVQRAAAVAPQQGLTLVAKDVRNEKEAIAALAALQQAGVDVIWILPDETNLSDPVIQQMLLLSYRSKIPLVGLSEKHADRGALLSLSFASSEDIGKQAAELANSILAGRPPAEVPPTNARQVHLTVNLKAAQKLGMVVPPGLIGIANNVIR